MSDETKFDLRERFTSEIEPLVDRLLTLCDEVGVPMAGVFCLASQGVEGDYCVVEVDRDGFRSTVIMGVLDVVTGRASITGRTQPGEEGI